MTILKITPMPAHRYIFQAVVEHREYLLRTRPYFGGPVMLPEPLPSKWSVAAKLPVKGSASGSGSVDSIANADANPFEDLPASQEIDFPNSSYIAQCGRCEGKGIHLCRFCNGRGYEEHRTTDSKGNSVYEERTCTTCHGSGSIKCSICSGMGKLVAWSYLLVSWKVATKTFNTERGEGELPESVLDEARYTATEINQFSLAGNIEPLQYNVDPSVTAAAKKIVEAALVQEDWRIPSANQSVVTIPVIEVEYKYGEEEGIFYVLGKERMTHFPSGFPGANCCECCCCKCCPDCCCAIT